MPLPSVKALAEANQRLNRPHPTTAPETSRVLPTPFAPGFILDQPIIRNQKTQVFRAKQAGLDRQVVVKFITCTSTLFDYQLLAREGNILGSLKHQHIVTLFQTGRWAKGVWLALEYCPRGSLALLLAEGVLPDAPAVAGLIRKVASAVHAAHCLGLIHNDIKPGNILLGEDGEPKLTDFGLARNLIELKRDPLRAPLAGTPAYMAPEQVQGGMPDIRTDVHGLGTVLYHLLTGRPPFSGATSHQIMVQVAHSTPPAPRALNKNIPADLAAICRKCLAKNPGERYQSAESLAHDLERFENGRPVLARKWTPWESTRRWAARNKATATAGLLAFCLLAFTTALLTVLVFLIQREKELALQNENLTTAYLEKAEAQAYASSVQAALFEMETGSTVAATELLTSLPFNRRGWEHNYITGRLRQNQVTLLDHGGPVLGLAIRPDRKVFASVSADRSVRLWDAETATPLKTALGSSHPFVGVTYSADGNHLAVADAEGWIRVMDSRTGTWTQALQVQVDMASNELARRVPFALSGDGSEIFFATKDHRIGQWSVQSGKVTKTFPSTHTSAILRLAFAPDQKIIVSADKDNQICVWDQETGSLVRKLSPPEKQVQGLAVSPDGRQVAAGCKDNLVYIWSLETGKIGLRLKGHEDWINTVNYDPSGSRIASAGDDHSILIWDAKTGTLLNTLRGHTDFVNSVHFSADGKCLISASTDNTIKFWNPENKQGMSGLIHSDLVRSIAFSPDSQTMATGSDDGFLRFWSVPRGTLVGKTRVSNRRLAGMRFSPDGSRLAVAGAEQQVHFFNTRDFTSLGRLPGHPGGVTALCFSPDGSSLFTAGFDGAISQWNLSTWKLEKTATVGPARPRAVAVSSDGEKFAVAFGDNIQVRSVVDWSVIHELRGHTNLVTDLAFSPDDKSLASGSNDRNIILWDASTGQKTKFFEGHNSPVSSLQFNPEGNRLLSTGFDRTIRLWDPVNGMDILTFRNHHAAIRRAVFSPDGQWIASAGDDNRVLLWDGSARMEEYKVRQFKSLSDLTEVVDAHNRLESENSTNTMNLPELLGPTQQKCWAVSRDGPDHIILDQQARAARLAREQSLLQSWK